MDNQISLLKSLHPDTPVGRFQLGGLIHTIESGADLSSIRDELAQTAGVHGGGVLKYLKITAMVVVGLIVVILVASGYMLYENIKKLIWSAEDKENARVQAELLKLIEDDRLKNAERNRLKNAEKVRRQKELAEKDRLKNAEKDRQANEKYIQQKKAQQLAIENKKYVSKTLTRQNKETNKRALQSNNYKKYNKLQSDNHKKDIKFHADRQKQSHIARKRRTRISKMTISQVEKEALNKLEVVREKKEALKEAAAEVNPTQGWGDWFWSDVIGVNALIETPGVMGGGQPDMYSWWMAVTILLIIICVCVLYCHITYVTPCRVCYLSR